MNSLIFLFFRRMRTPLLVLLGAYAVSIGGLVLVPGIDDQGNPWRFDFFHAFYFVSFMGSTIGFGEIPYAFSAAQRLWTTVALYLTVISWLYAIGNILTLIQNPAFKRALTEQRFTRSVRRIREPFYLVCGYGDTGSLLVSALDRRNIRSVVVDMEQERINELTLENLSFDVPGLCGDAREVRHLVEAGLQHPMCIGVVALTNVDDANVKIAITSKLLNPALKVICRAESRNAAANMASFDTDHIINPYDIFAAHLTMALRRPSVHLLHNWLTRVPNHPLPEPINPPMGTWIICNFGPFGRSIQRYMEYEGMPTAIVEARPEQAPKGAVIGVGTEAVTLREAGVDKAVGIVAGADQDYNNLSIVVTARELNPDLFLIARQNLRSNEAVFEAADLDSSMQSSRIIVWRILPLLTRPLLSEFLRLARHRNEEWAQQLLSQIRGVSGDVTPQTWSVEIKAGQALYAALAQGQTLRIQHLLSSPQDRKVALPAFPLMLLRGDEEIMLPDHTEPLKIGDRLLFCGRYGTDKHMAWIVYNLNVLEYVETGDERPDGYVWRWLSRRQRRRREAGPARGNA